MGRSVTKQVRPPDATSLGLSVKRGSRQPSAATQVLLCPCEVIFDQRGIGRFLGSGIRPIMGSSSVTAARVLGALLKISSAVFW